ncbi:MAG: type II toxin-antitoxin system RelB/DinJ family antitoxin [Paludibacteraceae bacterium]|nr:type II toxin-antitoxin system RelB/DinJ family antitoxin [Paludibacteraceae bacterium]
MAQATMTVRTDAVLKATFDSLCEQFGMSANTAMNIFMRAVAETRSIPFRIGKSNISPEVRYQQALERMHQDAIRRNEPELTLEEINAEIAAYRAERATKRKMQAL